MLRTGAHTELVLFLVSPLLHQVRLRMRHVIQDLVGLLPSFHRTLKPPLQPHEQRLSLTAVNAPELTIYQNQPTTFLQEAAEEKVS